MIFLLTLIFDEFDEFDEFHEFDEFDEFHEFDWIRLKRCGSTWSYHTVQLPFFFLRWLQV